MASSIKIRDETKRELDKLQATLLLKAGKKLSQQDIIELLVALGSKDPMVLISINSTSPYDLDSLLDLSEDWEIETSPEKIDDILFKAIK